jgi:gluconate 5-dehydrogenase
MAGGSGVDLDGTRALVTGGTSGIGLAMAGALARAGATVVLTSRSAERATAAAARLPGDLGLAAAASDEISVARAADQAWPGSAASTCWSTRARDADGQPAFLTEPGILEVPPRVPGGRRET